MVSFTLFLELEAALPASSPRALTVSNSITPIMMKSMTSEAGPPEFKALPDPTKRPAPIEPPMAIICMCLPLRDLFSFPLSPSDTSILPTGDVAPDASTSVSYFSFEAISSTPILAVCVCSTFVKKTAVEWNCSARLWREDRSGL